MPIGRMKLRPKGMKQIKEIRSQYAWCGADRPLEQI